MLCIHYHYITKSMHDIMKCLSNTFVSVWQEGQERKGPTDTTLTVHFFGKRGNDVLKYEDFHRWVTSVFITVDSWIFASLFILQVSQVYFNSWR